ncbi:MAG: thiamine pyrophosphate-dependent enzyme [Bacillota bacterium]|nr:thiamine pyrophosphate-dependent enzyme [Bacillota bacterium]
MSVNLKELATRGSPLTSGHRLCDGCAAPTIAKQVMLGAGKPVVIVQPTGCLEISSVVFPYTAWKTPYYHNAFENAAAVASGVEAALKARKRRGDLPADFDVAVVAIGGDGGTYDIGFQALSGALERGHRMLYVCYDNGAYMNTGIQRSGATPFGAWTTTTHVGSAYKGKVQHRKDLTAIAADHNAAYVAQASPHNFRDLMRKVKKAVDADGASFLNVISPCWRGWRFPEEETIEMARLAVETCYWPLYEVERGKVTVSYVPREKKPVSEWLKKQGRFSHFFAPGNEGMLAELQAEVDREWEELLARAGRR